MLSYASTILGTRNIAVKNRYLLSKSINLPINTLQVEINTVEKNTIGQRIE